MLKTKQLINKIKNKFKKNKFLIYTGLSCFAGLIIPISIYFTQTAYFYSMSKVDKKDFKNLDTIYSYDSFITNKYKRVIPSTYNTNIPLERYAWYNNPWYVDKYNKKDETSLNNAREIIVQEAQQMMDLNNLKKEVENKTLKKHPSADYMYGYDQRIPDNALAVVKNFNVDLTRKGTLTTGLYIAPGEIVKLNFKGLTNDQVKKLNAKLIIGDNDHDNYDNDKSKPRPNNGGWFHRMPIIRREIPIDKSYFEFGTPFGGIVNIYFPGETSLELPNVGVIIDGAIEALHYVHGYTTEEEWYRLVKEAKAPVAEIASDYVSFVTPKLNLSNLRKPKNNKTPPPNPIDPKWYPYKVMDLFNKMAMDGHYTINRAQNKVPKFRFLSSQYVTAGEAYAGGELLVIQPWYWTEDILDYEKILNQGNWGIMHEMNHHNQGSSLEGRWGFSGNGERSNNVVTISSYLNWTNNLSDRDNIDVNNFINNVYPNREIYHEHKINGFLSQHYINKKYNQGVQENKNPREGFDTDYTVIMANFGTKGFQDTVRTYSQTEALNAFGDPIHKQNFVDNLSSANNLEKEANDNAKFVDRISQITGYNWSQYYLDTKIIRDSEAKKINDHLKNLTSKYNSNNTTKKFKPYAPLYSFYASDVKYDVGSPISEYRKTAAPFLIKKKYFETGFNFKIEELLVTSESWNSKVNTSLYEISNVKLIGNGAKYGTMSKNTSSSTKLEYIYKPNLKMIDKLDEFEFSADIVRKKMEPNQKDLLSSENEKITVNFKVKIRLEGSNAELEVPNNLNYIQYKPDALISQFDKLVNVVMDNPKKENGRKTHEYWNENTTEKNLLQKYPINGLQVKPNNDDIILNLTFKDFININGFTFYNAIDQGVPYGLKIEDTSNINTPKEILNTIYLKENKATYIFPRVKTKNIRISFLKNNSITTGNKREWLKLQRFDFGMFGKGSKIFPANSSSIQTIGDWRKGVGKSKYNKDSISTINPFTSAYIGLRNSDSFTIIGSKDKNYGKFDVYIDNNFYQTVDVSNYSRFDNVPLLIISDINLNYGQNKDHVIKIINKSVKPIEIQGFNIENDATIFNPNINDPYYLLVILIPILSIIFIITCIILVLILLKKKRKIVSS